MIDLNLAAALPETFLAVAAMILLLLGVFKGRGATALVLWLSVACLALAFVIVAASMGRQEMALGGFFIADAFGDFMKLLVLAGSAVSLVMALRYIEREDMARFEFSVLILLATVGMMMMISANDMRSEEHTSELQSLMRISYAVFF